MNPSSALARLVVDEMFRHGVRDAVVAPGSRSAPFALALHAAAAEGRVRLHVRVDERSAGFVALGLARGSRRPVPVVTTSGSAVAHLYPAVLEAHHAGLPLVVVSADRPAELRGSGANQTTEQAGLFDAVARLSIDVPADVLAASPGSDGWVTAVGDWRAQVSRSLLAATGAASGDPGPVQLNCRFAPPLVPGPADDGSVPPGRPGGRPWTVVAGGPVPGPVGTPVELALGPRTVVVAGADAGSPARLLAQRAGWPLVAEPTSGSRTGDHALRCGALLLGHAPLASRVQRVVVAGRPTLSRTVTALLSRPDVEVVVVADSPRWSDPGNRAAAVVPAGAVPTGAVPTGAVPTGAGPTAAKARDDAVWRAHWLEADRLAGAAVDGVLVAAADRLPSGLLLGAQVADAVSRAVPPGGLLVVGSSSPVRDLDLVARPYPPGERRRVVANRGLSGIDGSVSTALGVALGRPSTRAFALLGDLTFCHDVGGLLLGPAEPRPDLTVVVVNDGGGSIFTTLEPGADRFAATFERLFATPTGVDLAALCAATRTPHCRVGDLPQLLAELAEPPTGVRVVEAAVDRAGRRRLHEELRQAVSAALDGLPLDG